MTDYPSLSTYKKLYRRFVEGGTQPKEFLAACQAEGLGRTIDFEGTTCLDLCAGGGEITEALVDRKARHVTMVDIEEQMLSEYMRFRRPANVTFLNQHVNFALEACEKFGVLFDAAFCRQGVNYWLEQGTVNRLAAVMKPGAPFVFNTFARCPPDKSAPLVKQYKYKDHHYVEVTWYSYGSVYHVQVVDDLPPHTTAFHYFSRVRLEELFAGNFNLQITEKNGVTLFCVARRKSDT